MNEWIKEADGLLTVGITKKAAAEIDEVTHIEFPKIGSHIQKDEAALVIESTKAAIDISFHVTGTVVAINERLYKEPELLLKDPEHEGWIMKINTQTA